jgi:glycosyltransferase involved in cell wall biosynthesis
MTRILLIGYKPPWFLHNRKIEAAHYRTWQFLQPLLEDGHQLCLCAGEYCEPDGPEESAGALPSNLAYHSISFGRKGWQEQLQKAHDSFQPDCIIAVNFSHCLYATKLRTDKPIWMDIYGDMLTIMQVAFYRAQSNRGLETSITFMQRVLRTGDVFSGCGQPQKHALVGELAMAGRLSKRTFGYEFARVVLPGSLATDREESFRHKARSWLKQFGISEESFVVLWCGGYNTWTDVDTLFEGLVWAMERDPKVCYLSLGANTYEAPDNVYARFGEMIQRSPHRDRFHLLGWQPWGDLPNYYHASDVGINIDALHYETLYGTRTRLVEMIGAGLPIITSTGAELSYLLQERGAARTFMIGDWQGLGQEILGLATDREACQALAARAYAVAKEELSFAHTTACVREWVREPRLAPDKGTPSWRERMLSVEYGMRALLRQFMWDVTGAEK